MGSTWPVTSHWAFTEPPGLSRRLAEDRISFTYPPLAGAVMAGVGVGVTLPSTSRKGA